MVRWLFMLPAILIGSLVSSRAPSQPVADATNYIYQTEVRRFALIVGNSNYSTQEKLPGTLSDARLIASALRALNFEVTEVEDVRTRSRFIYEVLNPFIDQIKPGSLAVFYFSGHGLSFGGESYLTPLDFPDSVPYQAVTSTFLSVTSLRDLISERHPAVAMMILDACRNVTSIIDTTGETSGRFQTKGLAPPLNDPSNTLIWFSSDAGATSLADPSGGSSVYTSALLKHISEPDRQIDLIRKLVRLDVMKASQNKQIPYTNESSSAELWLKPTAQTIAQIQDLWASVLESGIRDQIASFVEIYGSTPFAAAAMRWLQDHPVGLPTASSTISPAAPEALWEIRPNSAVVLGTTGTGQSINPLSITGPLAMSRTLDAKTTLRIMQSFPASLSLKETEADIATPERQTAQVLAQQGTVVTQIPIQASRSLTGGRTDVRIPSGSTLHIDGFLMDESNKTVLQASSPQLEGQFFVSVTGETKFSTKQIGSPVLQVSAPAAASGPLATVDEAPILAGLDTVKNSGKSLSWVSIATPSASGPRNAELLSLRATYALHILVKNGVPRDIITTVQGAAAGEADLRLRFFAREP
jgi:hypothetical protein